MNLSKDKLKFFAKMIQEELGIQYLEESYYQLDSRLAVIAKKHGFDSCDALYASAVKGLPIQVRDALLDEATNNETFFFRDEKIFKDLGNEIIPKLKDSGRTSFRIWSCACSRGQEIYTIAMTLQNQQGWGTAWNYSLDCSDVSKSALAFAQEGLYTKLDLDRGLSTEQKLRFFTEEKQAGHESSWRVKPTLQKSTRFFLFNLVGSWAGVPKYDVIFCRHVLIYQGLESRTKILRHLYDSLVPGGVLVLGGTESLVGIDVNFKQVRIGSTYWFQKPEIEEEIKGVG